MTRRQHIENIIIGSLIASFDDYWPEVRSCITEDMLEDTLNRDTYRMMAALTSQRQEVNLLTLTDGGNRPASECARLAELAADYDFDFLKWQENNRRWMAGQPLCSPTFAQYVTKYLTL